MDLPFSSDSPAIGASSYRPNNPCLTCDGLHGFHFSARIGIDAL